MKLITVYIQPERLEQVKEELFAANVMKFSITNSLGCGKEKKYSESYRGVMEEVDLMKKLRLEIAINDEYVDKAITAIINGARTSKIGDGKIFVQNLDQCIRIRTGESDREAIG
jgi:nitrogen regulatory protein P-II 1